MRIVPVSMLFAWLAACNGDSQVTANNADPTATITAPEDGDSFSETSRVTLRGAASDPDNDASELSVAWFLGDEPLCDAVPPADDGTTLCAADLVPGDYTARMEVKDPQNATASDEVSFTVIAAEAPVASITSPTDSELYVTDVNITFTGTISDVEDPATLLHAAWSSDLDGELTGVSAIPDTSGHVSGTGRLSPGTHRITLTVEDTTGKVGADSVIIEVAPSNTAPHCAITTTTGGHSDEGADATFEGATYDPDQASNTLDVAWSSDHDGDLGASTPDGNGDVLIVTDALSVATHVITMTVTDDLGATCTDTITWTVGDPPLAFITAPADNTVYAAGDDVQLKATVGDSQTAPEDLVLTWESDLDGVFDRTPADSSGKAIVDIDTLSIGDHVIQLTAVDADGLYTIDTVHVSINGRPTAPTVRINPAPAATDDDLRAIIATPSFDPEGDVVTYTFEWFLDGVPSAVSNSALVAAADTAKGETWKVRVTPSDGRSIGPFAEATATIVDSQPSIGGIAIEPSPLTVEDTASCVASGYADADGDPDLSTWAWTVNGAAAGTQTTLAGAFVRGDVVKCTVSPFDGELGGVPKSLQVSVANALPRVADVTITPGAPLATDTLTCGWSGYYDADGDAEASRLQWSVNGVVVGNGFTLSSGFTNNDVVVCTVTPNDGLEDGPTATAQVRIANRPPVLADVALSPDPAYEADLLDCAPGVTTDPDGTTAFTYAYRWEVGGTPIAATTSWLDGADFDRDDVVQCFVTPNDGGSDGLEVASNAIAVGNTAPAVDAIVLTPARPGADDAITATVQASDADNDVLTFTYAWTVDGVADATAGDTLDPAAFDRGQTVGVTVTPDDGTDVGTPMYVEIVIANTPPDQPVIEINPADPIATVDDLSCDLVGTVTDADGDSVSVLATWTVDGVVFGDPSVSTPIIDAADTSAGETWECTVVADDGVDTSAPATASVVVLGVPVGYAHVQYPCSSDAVPSWSAVSADPLDVYGIVYLAGSTPGTGRGAGIEGEVGYGPDGSDPSVDASAWTWFPGAYNGDKDAFAANDLRNDEYLGSFAAPVVTADTHFDVAWRFTTDGGLSWVYGDLGSSFGADACDAYGGSADGYSATDAADLLVQP
jgi:hypothetical protein